MEFLIKNRVKIVFILFTLILILIFWIAASKYSSENSYISESGFSNVKELLKYMDSTYIKEKNSSEKDFKKDIYLKFKYPPLNEENGQSYEDYYTDIVLGIADVLNYINYILIDEEKNLKIKVTCNAENKKIVSFSVNDDRNYFTNIENRNQIGTYEKKDKKASSINSDILNKVVNNNWSSAGISFGNKVSSLDEYDIYFNEGIKVRIIDDVIFNIIFTNKYKSDVVNGINTSMKLDEIVSKIGSPYYGSVDEGIIGYSYDKMYMFCSQNTISIYPYIDYSESKKISSLIDNMSNFVESYEDVISLFMEAPSNAPIIDKYEIYPNNGIVVQSTLMGLKFIFNKENKDGVYFYSNFEGYVKNDYRLSDLAIDTSLVNFSNRYIINENLMYENEKERVSKYIFDTSTDLSNGKFLIYYNQDFDKSIDQFVPNGINIVVKDNVYPDFSIDNIVTSTVILSDYKFAYSVENVGIYVCDISTREQKLIVSGEGSFKIKSYENNVLKYDDKEIEIENN